MKMPRRGTATTIVNLIKSFSEEETASSDHAVDPLVPRSTGSEVHESRRPRVPGTTGPWVQGSASPGHSVCITALQIMNVPLVPLFSTLDHDRVMLSLRL